MASAGSGYDIVIVGGAVMGSSTAWHLAQKLGSGASILVIEKDMTFTKCASALSGSSIRQQYSARVNIEISLYGINYLRNIGENLRVGDDRPTNKVHEHGYLYLAGPEGAPILAENQALQAELGADILYLDVAGLKERFPYINMEGLVAGTWGRTGEGWFDGYGLMQAFRNKARSVGVTYLNGEVTSVDYTDGRVSGVKLADGSAIACKVLVNAAGASGNRRVAEMAGVKIPVWGKKRCIYQFSAKDKLERFPLMIDKSGVWARAEGENFLCGFSPDDLDETDASDDFEVDWSLFEEIVWPTIAERVPAFETIKPGGAWAGHYDMNLFDHNAIIGRLGDFENMYVLAGFSGHGLQQSPAMGRGMAELIVDGRFTTLDLSELGFDRIAANRPVLENNVI